MQVDPRKVNLAEADIEQYLFENPGEVWVLDENRLPSELICVSKWLKRQYPVPSGVIDLLGVTERGHVVVVEIKNIYLKADAITQVKRYAFDINQILATSQRGSRCLPVLVCPPIDERIFRECEACGVTVNMFSVSFSLDVQFAQWNAQTAKGRQEAYQEIAEQELPGNVWAANCESFFGSDDVAGQHLRRKVGFFDRLFGADGIGLVVPPEHDDCSAPMPDGIPEEEL